MGDYTVTKIEGTRIFLSGPNHLDVEVNYDAEHGITAPAVAAILAEYGLSTAEITAIQERGHHQ